MWNKAWTAQQAQDIDQLAIEKIGIPSIVLMENAGRLTAVEIIRKFKSPQGTSICIFCGTGNNGGDGFVVARYLWDAGFKVKVFLVGSPQKLKKDPRINYHILKKIKCSPKAISRLTPEARKEICKSDLCVDALFGVGLNRGIQEPFRTIIEALNHSAKEIFSIDVPSGLDATTGKTQGVCVKANVTVTLAVLKQGFLRREGPHYAGKIIVADIGIPRRVIQEGLRS